MLLSEDVSEREELERQKLKNSKQELVWEVEEQERNKKCSATFSTILRYLYADMSRAPRSL